MIDKARAKKDGRRGIGLSICKKVIEIHHSKLLIDNKLGEGTTVSFYLEIEENES